MVLYLAPHLGIIKREQWYQTVPSGSRGSVDEIHVGGEIGKYWRWPPVRRLPLEPRGVVKG